ncbi:hypothetical protein CRUP_036855 [Coryphaenoides rupestris]|nr:hypothetical protein CRUP_036855 [Coryphaenoides rupestris]
MKRSIVRQHCQGIRGLGLRRPQASTPGGVEKPGGSEAEQTPAEAQGVTAVFGLLMSCSRRALHQWFLAGFLLCSPAPHYGRPIDALSGRMKRSVTHAQLMHDKGRTLQDFKRRMWLQELLHEVHTAAVRDLPARPAPPTGTGGGSSSIGGVGAAGGVGVAGGVGGGGGVGGVNVVLPGLATTTHLSTTGSTLHSKPPGGTKNLPLGFRPEEEEGAGTNLPQETNKSQAYNKERASGKRKKKGRSGKRREGEKRRRRARALGRAAEPGRPGGPSGPCGDGPSTSTAPLRAPETTLSASDKESCRNVDTYKLMLQASVLVIV